MPDLGAEEHESQAPATGAQTEQPAAVARLRAALLHPSRGQVVAAVLVGLLAFAGVTQVRLTDDDDTYASMRSSDLIQTLNGLTAASRRAESEISRLESTRSKLQNSSERHSAAVKEARTEMNTLGILAGTLPARGPGLEITVTNASDTNPVGLNTLLDGVEELRDAGAEAMQFNDSVRVVAQTSFDQGSSGIVVDGHTLRSPYVIDVIGDPDTMATALGVAGGFVDDVELDGAGKVSVKKLTKVEVDVTRKATASGYAEPGDG